jgi:hypothetical protein
MQKSKSLNLLKSIVLVSSLVSAGSTWAVPQLPTCVVNYSVSNATLSDGGTLNGSWTVDWTQSPPALTASNLAITGGTAGYTGHSFPVPGTIDNPLRSITSESSGSFYAATIKALANTNYIWLMFEINNGVLQYKNGPNYVSVNGISLTFFNNSSDVGTATAVGSCISSPTPASIPTLTEWGMIFMASLMAMFGIRRMRRSK